MAKHIIGDTTIIEGKYDTVFVTRPSMLSHRNHTMCISGVHPPDLVKWLIGRRDGTDQRLIQEVFPLLSAIDREFLLTGITPEEWTKTFPPEEEVGK